MTAAQTFIDIRRALHQIPEPGFEEWKTQAYLLDFIKKLPQASLEVETWRTGILVRVRGADATRTIGWRTDIDGLPITEETASPFASTHKGYMHACGHDLHMTIALAVLSHFASNPAKDDLVFLFQPAEEGPGGALPMLQSDIFTRFRPDAIFALHIAPEYPVGTIATKPGLLFANTSELFIDLRGKGGHAAYPHRANDMVVAAAHLVTQLQSVVSRNVDPLDAAVITIGKIESGVRQNVIADHARLEGTIRTLSQPSMQAIQARVEAISAGIAASFGCEVAINYGSGYMQVVNDEASVRALQRSVAKLEGITFTTCDVAMTGEDFGYFLDAIPGCMFWLGVDTPFGLHHAKLAPNEAAIDVATRVVIQFLSDAAGEFLK